MKRRISKQVREEAVYLCAVAASNSWMNCPEARPSPSGEGVPSADLAWAAMAVAYKAWECGSANDWTPDTHWAEAEAMLRTGWCPP